MNEPLNDGIVGAAGSARDRPTFSRVLLVLAATVVVLVGMRLAAPVLNPIIFAVVLSFLFGPVYAWLVRRRLVLSPMLMSRGLSISPTIVFLSFVFWAWLLGRPGAFLALPITLFVAVMFDTFLETRWLANFVGISSPDAEPEGPL